MIFYEGILLLILFYLIKPFLCLLMLSLLFLLSSSSSSSSSLIVLSCFPIPTAHVYRQLSEPWLNFQPSQAVQTKSILDIAQELNALQELGKQSRLGPEHLAPGTFSLSNIGTVGGTYTKPVIVVPQVPEPIPVEAICFSVFLFLYRLTVSRTQSRQPCRCLAQVPLLGCILSWHGWGRSMHQQARSLLTSCFLFVSGCHWCRW